MQANPYPLRIEKDIMDKTRFIASLNGRSVNKEIEFTLRNKIKEYEDANGPIPLPDFSE